MKMSGADLAKWEAENPSSVGWSPGCSCQAPTVPALCLDPFLGSGTTLAVAKLLGLRGIGIELSEDHCQQARERIATVNRDDLTRRPSTVDGAPSLFDNVED